LEGLAVPDRLYRSRSDRMLFGVAGGLARYLNVDPSIVRIVWVLLFFAAGAGILLYVVAAFLVPEEPAGYVAGSAASVAAGEGAATDRSPYERRDTGGGAILIGVILLLVGGWLLLERFLPTLEGRVVWPAILIIVGLVLVLGSLRGRGRA
jgi:phage shock protein C